MGGCIRPGARFALFCGCLLLVVGWAAALGASGVVEGAARGKFTQDEYRSRCDGSVAYDVNMVLRLPVARDADLLARSDEIRLRDTRNDYMRVMHVGADEQVWSRGLHPGARTYHAAERRCEQECALTLVNLPSALSPRSARDPLSGDVCQR